MQHEQQTQEPHSVSTNIQRISHCEVMGYHRYGDMFAQNISVSVYIIIHFIIGTLREVLLIEDIIIKLYYMGTAS